MTHHCYKLILIVFMLSAISGCRPRYLSDNTGFAFKEAFERQIRQGKSEASTQSSLFYGRDASSAINGLARQSRSKKTNVRSGGTSILKTR